MQITAFHLIAYMEQSIPLLSAHLGICISKHEADRSKEVTLAGPIMTNNHIVLGRKGFNDRLLLVTNLLSAATKIATRGKQSPFESLDDDLLDMHVDFLSAP